MTQFTLRKVYNPASTETPKRMSELENIHHKTFSKFIKCLVKCIVHLGKKCKKQKQTELAQEKKVRKTILKSLMILKKLGKNNWLNFQCHPVCLYHNSKSIFPKPIKLFVSAAL